MIIVPVLISSTAVPESNKLAYIWVCFRVYLIWDHPIYELNMEVAHRRAEDNVVAFIQSAWQTNSEDLLDLFMFRLAKPNALGGKSHPQSLIFYRIEVVTGAL